MLHWRTAFDLMAPYIASRWLREEGAEEYHPEDFDRDDSNVLVSYEMDEERLTNEIHIRTEPGVITSNGVKEVIRVEDPPAWAVYFYASVTRHDLLVQSLEELLPLARPCHHNEWDPGHPKDLNLPLDIFTADGKPPCKTTA